MHLTDRIRIYLEPRDLWVGLYVSPRHLYWCPLPCLVVRWTRKRRIKYPLVPNCAGCGHMWALHGLNYRGGDCYADSDCPCLEYEASGEKPGVLPILRALAGTLRRPRG